MKVSEIDFDSLQFRAISVITPHNTVNFPGGEREVVVRLYGEETLTGDPPVVTDENGYLTLTVSGTGKNPQ